MTRKMSFAQYGDGGPTIWRAPPSPEVDEAWDRMVIEDLWPVSQSQIKKMWKDHTVIAKLPALEEKALHVARNAYPALNLTLDVADSVGQPHIKSNSSTT